MEKSTSAYLGKIPEIAKGAIAKGNQKVKLSVKLKVSPDKPKKSTRRYYGEQGLGIR